MPSRLAADGHAVVLNDRFAEGLEETSGSIRDAGGLRSALPAMIEQGSGSIVNVASNAGLLAAFDRGAFGRASSLVSGP